MSTNQFDGYQVVALQNNKLSNITNDPLGKATIEYANVKYNYTTNKNIFIILLLFVIIGNSSLYYYFENLKNVNAWPSHGAGGLFRKALVHCVGLFFLYSMVMYVKYSGHIMNSDLIYSYGASYVKNPYTTLDVDGITDPTKVLIPVIYDKYDSIKDDALNGTAIESIDSSPNWLKSSIIDYTGNKVPDNEITTSKPNDRAKFLFTVVICILFANIITLKGYPIYGVTYGYNPLSALRFTEVIGLLMGNTSAMLFLNKYVNVFFGHTFYGTKGAFYDAYKMRNVPIYSDSPYSGYQDAKNMYDSRLFKFVFGSAIGFFYTGVMFFSKLIYVYTCITIFLNPIFAVVLCLVGYVSATPEVFVSGNNAITSLDKKIDMFILKRWLFYFTQGRCYKGNVFAGVLRRLCTLGFDTWVADALFNNEYLALACEEPMKLWWRGGLLNPRGKCKKKNFDFSNYTFSDYIKNSPNNFFYKIVYFIVKLLTGGISDIFTIVLPKLFNWHTNIDYYDNLPYEKQQGIWHKCKRSFVYFVFYVCFGFPRAILGLGYFKTVGKSYFGGLLRLSIMFFVATAFYSTTAGIWSTGVKFGKASTYYNFQHLMAYFGAIVFLMFTFLADTDYGIKLPNISLITDPHYSFVKLFGIKLSKKKSRSNPNQSVTTSAVEATAAATASPVNVNVTVGEATGEAVGTGAAIGGAANTGANTAKSRNNNDYAFIDIDSTHEKFKQLYSDNYDCKKSISNYIYNLGTNKFKSFYKILLDNVKSNKYLTLFKEILKTTKNIDNKDIKNLNDSLYILTSDTSTDEIQLVDISNVYYYILKKIYEKLDSDPVSTIKNLSFINNDDELTKLCKEFMLDFTSQYIDTECANMSTVDNQVTSITESVPIVTPKLKEYVKNVIKLDNKEKIRNINKNIFDILNLIYEYNHFINEPNNSVKKKIYLNKLDDKRGDMKKYLINICNNSFTGKKYNSNNTKSFKDCTEQLPDLLKILDKVFDKYSSNKSSISGSKASITTTGQLAKVDQNVINYLAHLHTGFNKYLNANSKIVNMEGGATAPSAPPPPPEPGSNNYTLQKIEEIVRKPQQQTSRPVDPISTRNTIYLDPGCDEKDDYCCAPTSTAFGKIEYDELRKNPFNYEKNKPLANVFKSKICSKNLVERYMDEGELYCLEGTQFGCDEYKGGQSSKGQYGGMVDYHQKENGTNQLIGYSVKGGASYLQMPSPVVAQNYGLGKKLLDERKYSGQKTAEKGLCDSNYILNYVKFVNRKNQETQETQKTQETAGGFDNGSSNFQESTGGAQSAPPQMPAAYTEPPYEPLPYAYTKPPPAPPLNQNSTNPTAEKGVDNPLIKDFTKIRPAYRSVLSTLTWNLPFSKNIFNPNGYAFYNNNYIPASVCSNLLISNIMMTLDESLNKGQTLQKIADNCSNVKGNKSTNNDNRGSIYNLLIHPMRKYYPMSDINPFNINMQMYGQKFSDWTQFFIGNSGNEDKSIYVTRSGVGGIVTIRDSYLYDLVSDKSNDSNVEDCRKMYCNKPRCFEAVKQCSRDPINYPDKMTFKHTYLKSTCRCSEIDGLMPIENDSSEEGKKYWLVAYLDPPPTIPIVDASNKCKAQRTPSETMKYSGVEYGKSYLKNIKKQKRQIKENIDTGITALKGQISRLDSSQNRFDKGLREFIGFSPANRNSSRGQTSEYKNALKGLQNEITREKRENAKSSSKLGTLNYRNQAQAPAPVPENASNVPMALPEYAGTAVPITASDNVPAAGIPNYATIGGAGYIETLSDLFGKWSDKIKSMQNTGKDYFIPVEYLDIKKGRKINLNHIMIDPVHSKIKVEGIDEIVDFSQEKLREIVDIYMESFQSEESRIDELSYDEQLKRKMSYNEYMNYKNSQQNNSNITNSNLTNTSNITNTSNTSNSINGPDDDIVIAKYDNDEQAKKIIEDYSKNKNKNKSENEIIKNLNKNNMSGGGNSDDKFITINGEKVILKFGKNEKYITKEGRLIGVAEYINSNKYVDVMTIDGEPMKIKVKGKEHYLTRSGELLKIMKKKKRYKY